MFRLLREPALKLRLLRERAPQPRGAPGSGMRRTLTPGASLDAVRRIESGLEFFTALMTQIVNGEVEYHGYPTP